MKLQIKDSGAWRNLFSVTDQQRPHVLAAAASFLTALNQPQTVMRLVENDVVLDSCAGPAFRWSGVSTCTCPSGDGSLSWPCPSHCLPASVPLDWMQFVEACAEAECCTINFSAIARRAKKLIMGVRAVPAQPLEPVIWYDASAGAIDGGQLYKSTRLLSITGSSEGPFGYFTTPLYAHRAPVQPVAVPDERAAFEASEPGMNLVRDKDGEYENPCVASGWKSWQARAAIAASKAGIEPLITSPL